MEKEEDRDEDEEEEEVRRRGRKWRRKLDGKIRRGKKMTKLNYLSNVREREKKGKINTSVGNGLD